MRFLPLLLILIATPALAEPLFIEKNYSGFTVYIDCRNNGPIAYHMTLAADAGDEPRLNDFKIDDSVPANC